VSGKPLEGFATAISAKTMCPPVGDNRRRLDTFVETSMAVFYQEAKRVRQASTRNVSMVVVEEFATRST